MVIDPAATALKSNVIDHLDSLATFCGVDIFLLGPKFASPTEVSNGNGDAGRDQRWRVAIYGDMESAEHAKTRVLIFIDKLVCTTNTILGDISLMIVSLDVLLTGPFSNSPFTLSCADARARTSSSSSQQLTQQSTFRLRSLRSIATALMAPRDAIQKRYSSQETPHRTLLWPSRRYMNSCHAPVFL